MVSVWLLQWAVGNQQHSNPRVFLVESGPDFDLGCRVVSPCLASAQSIQAL